LLIAGARSSRTEATNRETHAAATMDSAEILADMLLEAQHATAASPEPPLTALPTLAQIPTQQSYPWGVIGGSLVSAHLHAALYCWLRGLANLPRRNAAASVNLIHGMFLATATFVLAMNPSLAPSPAAVTMYSAGHVIYQCGGAIAGPLRTETLLRLAGVLYFEAAALSVYHALSATS
jgi:hypothetical protein